MEPAGAKHLKENSIDAALQHVGPREEERIGYISDSTMALALEIYISLEPLRLNIPTRSPLGFQSGENRT